MSITDELREYANTRISPNKGMLTAIADRIDAEHEKAIQQVLIGEGGVPATDGNMAEHGWVRLPVDADGEYIHIGDVMEYPNGGREEVRFMTLNGAGWLVNEAGWLPVQIHHHHEPTVKDVLREFAEKIIDSQIPNVHPTYEEAIAEYVSKLRLADDRDEQ